MTCHRDLSDLWYNPSILRRMRRGQAAAEYVIVLASLLIVVSILYGFVCAAERYAVRTDSLVTSDCP